jgi:hypothetical protein
MKMYFEVNESEEVIKVTDGYEKGGFNYFNGETNGRGYYLYVIPVTIVQQKGYKTESMVLFDGFKRLLLETKRQSIKAQETAERMAIEIAYEMANELAKQKGWTLKKLVA